MESLLWLVSHPRAGICISGIWVARLGQISPHPNWQPMRNGLQKELKPLKNRLGLWSHPIGFVICAVKIHVGLLLWLGYKYNLLWVDYSLQTLL